MAHIQKFGTEETIYDVAEIANYVIKSIKIDLPNSIYCPFCADEFMFDFSLQHHLEQNHELELTKFIQNTGQKVFPCGVCGAAFYFAGLIPKHLAQHHGNEVLREWRLDKQNINDYEEYKKIEPSIIYAICSPGMSDIYRSLDYTNNASVRRKLRFDMPNLKELSTPLNIVTKLASRSSILSNNLRNFSRRIFSDRDSSINNSSKFLTSTPINFLDSDSKTRRWSLLEEETRQNVSCRSHLTFSKEKFQCARCKLTWDDNRDLLAHIKSAHRNFLKHLFGPKYRCSLCGVKYYRNKHLVKHCTFAHAIK